MAPAILKDLLDGAISARNTLDADIASLGPMQARAALLARDDTSSTYDPGHGAIQYTDINNNAMFALFGILGAGIVVTGIWFFFWAKNGGFYFKQNDWDDYKSTVLRRKGPNGTILSGATPSTILGGGSIYKDIDDGTTEGDATTVVSGTTGITGITGGVSDIAGREKRRRKREQKEREKERRREEKAREREEKRSGRKSSRRHVGPDGALIDEQAEQDAKDHLRQYRHEKPARVGGINKESEGSQWDGSTNPSNSTVTGSRAGASSSAPTEETQSEVTELMSHREKTPTSTPTKQEKSEKRERERERERKAGGIRKVYSTADKREDRERERIRAEARRLQEKGRAAASSSRRDFSWQGAGESSSSSLRRIDEASHAGTESEIGTSSDLGTKVYHHSVHIPVSSAGSDVSYAEEKRKKRGGAGYRRERGE